MDESTDLAAHNQKLAIVLKRAQVLCEKNDYVAAEEILMPMMLKYREQPNLIYALGVAKKGQGKWEEAENLFKEALSLDPKYAI